MESRWFRRAGPGIAAIGTMAFVVSATTGAVPATWDPPVCLGSAAPGAAPIGAWFRLDPVLAEGVLVGQRLAVGRSGMAVPRLLDLDAESFASGPVGGTVLVGTDDGRASTVWLFDLAAGCRWAVASSADVIRAARLSPDGRSMVESRVDRRSRADRGIWRRPLDGRSTVRLLGPIEPDARFGPTWVTELAWSEDGATLVVASCGEKSCRFRLVPTASGATSTVADPALGALVGLAGDHLVARGACRGLPCPLVSIDVTSGSTVTLHEAAGLAVLVRDDDGRSIIVHEVGADGAAIGAVAPDGGRVRSLDGPPPGTRLVAAAAWAGSGAEHADDRIVFAPDGRLPIDGARPAIVRRVSDAPAIQLDEVLR